MPIAGEDHITLKATATFTTRSFEAGKYRVSVGLTHALLHLDHPSFERENAYQATLPKETWSESWKSRKDTHAAGEVKAKLGAKIGAWLNIGASGEAGKDSRESAEQKASTPYRIVSSTPTGWQIGTELGDPRTPAGALPEGLESCLNGEYLSGREHGEGYKDKDKALCVLKPKVGGNDPQIMASLFGVSGSLKVSITPSESIVDTHSVLQNQSEIRTREDEMRKAFIDICLQRAADQGARTDAMLSGEFYLSEHKVHAPKLAQQDTRTKPKGNANEQTSATDPKG